jgi:hypothetical protein
VDPRLSGCAVCAGHDAGHLHDGWCRAPYRGARRHHRYASGSMPHAGSMGGRCLSQALRARRREVLVTCSRRERVLSLAPVPSRSGCGSSRRPSPLVLFPLGTELKRLRRNGAPGTGRRCAPRGRRKENSPAGNYFSWRLSKLSPRACAFSARVGAGTGTGTGARTRLATLVSELDPSSPTRDVAKRVDEAVSTAERAIARRTAARHCRQPRRLIVRCTARNVTELHSQNGRAVCNASLNTSRAGRVQYAMLTA